MSGTRDATNALRRSTADEASRGRTMRRTSDGARSRRTHFTINPAAVSSNASTSHPSPATVTSIATPQSGRFAFAVPAAEFTEDIGMLAASVAASLASTSASSSSPYTQAQTSKQLAAATASALATLGFEAPVRNATFETLLPINSSLPDDYAPAFDEMRTASIKGDPTKLALDYIMLDHGNTRLPYTNSKLPTIDDGSFQLWNSLQDFRAVTEDYAAGYVKTTRQGQKTAGSSTPVAVAPHPLPDGVASDQGPPPQCPAFASSRSAKSLAAIQTVRRVFNWASLPDLPLDLEQTWYGVAFRSARREGSESTNLYEADRRAHEEAVASGGLLMYWYGAPHQVTGENLATCVWTSRQDAIQASNLPYHAEAAAHSLPAFRVFDLTRYAVRKVRGETKLRIDTWTEDE
ncbi:unnamed protein product [Tilletia controversa]|nr:unnamed protein product [Tilletia controversa]CAD6980708.1 unnamed protein product [Tilletia controversa]